MCCSKKSSNLVVMEKNFFRSQPLLAEWLCLPPKFYPTPAQMRQPTALSGLTPGHRPKTRTFLALFWGAAMGRIGGTGFQEEYCCTYPDLSNPSVYSAGLSRHSFLKRRAEEDGSNLLPIFNYPQEVGDWWGDKNREQPRF